MTRQDVKAWAVVTVLLLVGGILDGMDPLLK
jgi:hypothetical protein